MYEERPASWFIDSHLLTSHIFSLLISSHLCLHKVHGTSSLGSFFWGVVVYKDTNSIYEDSAF